MTRARCSTLPTWGASSASCPTTTPRPSGSAARSPTGPSWKERSTGSARPSRPTSSGVRWRAPRHRRVLRGLLVRPRPIRPARAGGAGRRRTGRASLTIVSSASVRAIGSHGDRPDLDARRFRIQLEIDGCDPYEEDSWDGRLVRVGEVTIRVRGQIPRCIVTTLGPDTGDKDFRTLNLIARTRPRIEGAEGCRSGCTRRWSSPAACGWAIRWSRSALLRRRRGPSPVGEQPREREPRDDRRRAEDREDEPELQDVHDDVQTGCLRSSVADSLPEAERSRLSPDRPAIASSREAGGCGGRSWRHRSRCSWSCSSSSGPTTGATA